MAVDVYTMVTDRIIAQLENNIIPWERPWFGVRNGAFNRVSKRPYSLLNQMLLKHQGEYASLKQWNTLGGRVRKGSKSEIVVFWKIIQREEEDKDGEKVVKNYPMLRYYNVFHISQIEGVEPLPQEKLKEAEPIEIAETLFNDYIKREGIQLEQVASNEAYYSPIRDLIHLPLIEQFDRIEEYYSTAFHEATHSTGAKCRLDRIKVSEIAHKTSDSYSQEELCAELGSASILNMLGIETTHSFKNSAAYIQSWLKVLRNDKKFIVSASSKAEKAVNYILNEEVAEA